MTLHLQVQTLNPKPLSEGTLTSSSIGAVGEKILRCELPDLSDGPMENETLDPMMLLRLPDFSSPQATMLLRFPFLSSNKPLRFMLRCPFFSSMALMRLLLRFPILSSNKPPRLLLRRPSFSSVTLLRLLPAMLDFIQLPACDDDVPSSAGVCVCGKLGLGRCLGERGRGI